MPPHSASAPRASSVKGDRVDRVRVAKLILSRAAQTRGRGTGPSVEQLHKSYYLSIQVRLLYISFNLITKNGSIPDAYTQHRRII